MSQLLAPLASVSVLDVELSLMTLMDRLMLTSQLSDMEKHCTCISRHMCHDKSGPCPCLENHLLTPVCECGAEERKERTVEELALHCIRKAPYIARFYANIGRILFKTSEKDPEKTAIRLPDESMEAGCSMHGRFVNVMELCLLALSLDPSTASAYALLGEAVKKEDPRGVIGIPDGRWMTVAELSNESLAVGAGAAPTLRRETSVQSSDASSSSTSVDRAQCSTNRSTSGGNVGNASGLRVAPITQHLGMGGKVTDGGTPRMLELILNKLNNIVILDNVIWLTKPLMESVASLSLHFMNGTTKVMSVGSSTKGLCDVDTSLFARDTPAGCIRLIEALNTCDLTFRQRGEVVDVIARSRALILSALIYFMLDAPPGVHKPPSGRPTGLFPADAAPYMSVHVPDYMDDGRAKLVEYISEVDAGRCVFDVLYPLALAILLRHDARLGAIKKVNIATPYAASWQLLQVCVSLTGAGKATKDNIAEWYVVRCHACLDLLPRCLICVSITFHFLFLYFIY
jgi:hypothetical protein